MDSQSRVTDNRSRDEILIIETSFESTKNTQTWSVSFFPSSHQPVNHSSVFTVISFCQIVASNSISICYMLMFNVHSTRKWSVHTWNVHILWLLFFPSHSICPSLHYLFYWFFELLRKLNFCFSTSPFRTRQQASWHGTLALAEGFEWMKLVRY